MSGALTKKDRDELRALMSSPGAALLADGVLWLLNTLDARDRELDDVARDRDAAQRSLEALRSEVAEMRAAAAKALLDDAAALSGHFSDVRGMLDGIALALHEEKTAIALSHVETTREAVEGLADIVLMRTPPRRLGRGRLHARLAALEEEIAAYRLDANKDLTALQRQHASDLHATREAGDHAVARERTLRMQAESELADVRRRLCDEARARGYAVGVATTQLAVIERIGKDCNEARAFIERVAAAVGELHADDVAHLHKTVREERRGLSQVMSERLLGAYESAVGSLALLEAELRESQDRSTINMKAAMDAEGRAKIAESEIARLRALVPAERSERAVTFAGCIVRDSVPQRGQLNTDGTVRLTDAATAALKLQPGDFVYFVTSGTDVRVLSGEMMDETINAPVSE